MILYRPQRGGLKEAMAEVKEFASLKDMFESVAKEHDGAFELEDMFVSYYCYDDRIDWETYIVTTIRYGEEQYDYPQAVGFCTFK